MQTPTSGLQVRENNNDKDIVVEAGQMGCRHLRQTYKSKETTDKYTVVWADQTGCRH